MRTDCAMCQRHVYCDYECAVCHAPLCGECDAIDGYCSDECAEEAYEHPDDLVL